MPFFENGCLLQRTHVKLKQWKKSIASSVPPLKKYRSFTIYYTTPVKPSTEKSWLTADTEFSLERFIVSKTSRS